MVRRGIAATTRRSRSATGQQSRSSRHRRPQLASHVTGMLYFADTAEVPEAQAVNVRNRSYTIGALVDVLQRPARRACSSRSDRGSAGTRYTSRTTGCTTSATSSAWPRKDRRRPGHPYQEEPDPLGLLRQGRRRAPGVSTPESFPCTPGIRRSAKAVSGPSARDVLPRRRGPVRRTRRRWWNR